MYNRTWAVVFLFSFHATVDLRHRSGMWIIFYFLYIPRRYRRSEPLYLFLLTFIYVYNTLLGLGKYFCFLGKLVLHSNTTPRGSVVGKIMYFIDIRSVGSLYHFIKGLIWFCKPCRNKPFFFSFQRRGTRSWKVIY